MTTPLTPQPFRIPIGYWDDGSREGVPVRISQEWFAYLAGEIFTRVGGASGSSTVEIFNLLLSNAQKPPDNGEDGEPGFGAPGPQGKQGPMGYAMRGEDGEDGESRIITTSNSASRRWASFTATRTGWTDIGVPTVTARYCTVENVCYFQVQVVPGTTVATVAGTSYIALPLTAAGLSGDGSMMNLSTLIGVGICAFDVANSRVYVPAQAATANTLTITGWYEV